MTHLFRSVKVLEQLCQVFINSQINHWTVLPISYASNQSTHPSNNEYCNVILCFYLTNLLRFGENLLDLCIAVEETSADIVAEIFD